MARAIDPRKTFDYVLRRDRALPEDAPDRTVWKLRPLTASELATIKDNAITYVERGEAGREMRLHSASSRRRVLLLGLNGWEKFPGEDGPVKFVGTRNGTAIEATDADLDRIPDEDRDELANAITAAGTLDQEALGKS